MRLQLMGGHGYVRDFRATANHDKQSHVSLGRLQESENRSMSMWVFIFLFIFSDWSKVRVCGRKIQPDSCRQKTQLLGQSFFGCSKPKFLWRFPLQAMSDSASRSISDDSLSMKPWLSEKAARGCSIPQVVWKSNQAIRCNSLNHQNILK